MPRVRGYHYVRDKSGRKRRVYGSRSGRSYGASRRRGSPIFGRVYGKGTYYTPKRRRPQSGRQLVNVPSTGGRSSRGRGIALVFNGTDPPKMSMTKAGVVVEHREYIQDISSSIPFIGENFPLNPGVKQTFPWLSQIAENFEEWVPEGILFEYKTTSSNTVVNTTNSNPGLGTVIIATQYNSLNADFGNKQQMENYENAVSVDPSRSVIHPIECARKQTPLDPLYVRTGAVGTQDLRWYDLGKTTVATVGQQTNNFTIGELWITYRIRFLKPKLLAGVGTDEDGTVDYFSFAAADTSLPATPFGTLTTLTPPSEGSTLGGVLSGGVTAIADQQNIVFPLSLGGPKPFPIFGFAGGAVSPAQIPSVANTYYFPPGISSGVFQIVYFNAYNIAGVPALQVITSGAATFGCQPFDPTGGAIPSGRNSSTANTNVDIIVAYLRVTANSARFSMTGTPGMTTPNGGQMWVRQLPANFPGV